MLGALRGRHGMGHSAQKPGAPSGRARALLLGITFVGSCAVYEPIITTRSDAAGGSAFADPIGGGGGSGATPAQSSGGEALPIPGEAGQASANDGGSRGLHVVSEDSEGGNRSASGAAGNDNAGAGSENQGGNGSAAGGGSAGSTSCIAQWRNRSDCDGCTTQRQPDLQACAVILDCYVSNGCGPSSCAYPDGKCGTNVLARGAAAYQIAQDVYACICK